MTDPVAPKTTRRTALLGGLAAAAAACTKTEQTPMSTAKLPAVYLPHGGGPWPFVDTFGPKEAWQGLLDYTKGLAEVPRERPAAILVISAHWEEAVPTVMTAARPPMLYDYYGFPKAAYDLQWPAPGDPALAQRVRDLLGAAGFETAADETRGFDHGTFVPLKVAYPHADIPTVQLSLVAGLDPETHLAMGRALAPLREQGVFIVGSGMSFHNMHAFRRGDGQALSQPFDNWLAETAPLPAAERESRLAAWDKAPGARAAHPREEHLLPLMVVAGAAGADPGTVPYRDRLMGAQVSAIHFG